MGVWRPKQEESKTIWFRVPASLKKEFEELRQQAEAEGMDAAATFTAALGRLARQLREELPQAKTPQQDAAVKVKANGLDHDAPAADRRCFLGARPMELLRRKKEGTGVISVRLPGSIYAKLVEQRQRAKLLGFNFNATPAGILSEGAKQIQQELIGAERKIQGTKRGKAESAAERMAG